MNWIEELEKRFGGFWNKVFLVVVLVVCLRIAGAEWQEKELGIRLLRGLYLILGVLATGVIFGLVRVVLAMRNPLPYGGRTTARDFAWGLKNGIGTATTVIFFVGILMVKDYLGPLQAIFDSVISKIGKKIP